MMESLIMICPDCKETWPKPHLICPRCDGDGIDYKKYEKEYMNMRLGIDPKSKLTHEDDVLDWGREKGILFNSDPKSQTLKTVSEIGELADAINKNEDIRDHVGDALVTLILVCAMCGVSLDECLTVAYNEIKNRKGKMVNGIFIKEIK